MRDTYAIIKDMVHEAERHADDLSNDRVRAMEYYRGDMKDTPSDEGRSRMVTRDVRAHVKKALPSLVRALFGGSAIVEYEPIGPGDEAGAEQATDYVNFVVVPEADIRGAVYDAIHDALLLRNGILKWWWDERQAVKISRHTGLDDNAFAVLAGEDSVDVLEHTAREEMTDLGPVQVHDVKLRRVYTERCIKVSAVPRERLLIHPDAVTFSDALLVGDRCEMRRSDLIGMGYDYDLVMGLSASDPDDYEESVRRDETLDADEAQRANSTVDYYDLFVRVDMDGDGIAELRHMVFAGGLAEKNLLVNEECDEVQMCDVAVMRQPHQWEAISLADDLMDLQRAKTVLFRQTLDNLYWQNNPQPVMQRGAVLNPEAVANPEFGKPIEVANGVDARGAMSFQMVPFVARESFAMMDYIDGEAQDRTGVTDASAGLAPDALQNMTAKASAMIEQAGIGQTEMMLRTVAESLRPFFKGILKLVVRHQDIPRTVRLRGEWVQFDPRHWNADMDVTVNTGLGAGTRERDMMMMQTVLGLQEKLLAAFGAGNNPFVKPENLWNSLSKLVEAAGLKTPDMYFTEPDPQEIAALLEAQKNKPDPEMMKVQAQMQMEQAKAQTQIAKEKAQMEADLIVEEKRMQAETKRQAEELAVKRELQSQQLAWEREKFEREMAFKAEAAQMSRQDEIWRRQAEQFGDIEGFNGELLNQEAMSRMGETSEALARVAAGQEALLRAVTQMSALISAPKELVRDEAGRPVGVRPVLQ